MRTAHAKAQIRKRRETDFWRGVNWFLVFLIGIGVVAFVTLAFLHTLRFSHEMNAQEAGLEKDLAAQKLLLLQQQREVKWLNSDPAYVELLARNLGMMKEGETIFRMDEATPVPGATPVTPVAPMDLPSSFTPTPTPAPKSKSSRAAKAAKASHADADR